MRLRLLFLFLFVFLFVSCAEEKAKAIKIAINPWPGYEFLFLAQEKGFFKKVGLNIKLVALDSLSDAQRAYIHGRVDGFASTMIEAVQAQALSKNPLKIVLIPDYSNGGDVIIAKSNVKTLKELKGKKIGGEISSLGLFLLHRALQLSDMALSDVNLINLEQNEGVMAMKKAEIDAFVTYPPFSLNILKESDTHVLFNSSQIPYEIIDTVSISVKSLNENPQFVPQLLEAWQMSLDYFYQHPKQASQIMADREGITAKEFTDIQSDLKVLDINEQKKLFSGTQALESRGVEICKTLVQFNALDYDCAQLKQMFYH